MIKLKNICVFCGSSEGNDIQIINTAKTLGKTIADQGYTLVYGAAKIGIMGILAKEVLDHKGSVIGIIPEFLKKKEVVHLGLTQLITTQNMHERKLYMQEQSDAFIALPGGMGTLEELFEIITWLQLGLHDKPIGLLNINGFYDALLSQLEEMVKRGFLKMENYNLLLVSESIADLFSKLNQFQAPRIPKWLNPERT